jgi:hypothetical protein
MNKLPLLSDEEIESIVNRFWDKYSGKGLSPSEVMELHHSELWQSIVQAEHDLCQLEYDKLFEINQIENSWHTRLNTAIMSYIPESENRIKIIDLIIEHNKEMKG